MELGRHIAVRIDVDAVPRGACDQIVEVKRVHRRAVDIAGEDEDRIDAAVRDRVQMPVGVIVLRIARMHHTAAQNGRAVVHPKIEMGRALNIQQILKKIPRLRRGAFVGADEAHAFVRDGNAVRTVLAERRVDLVADRTPNGRFRVVRFHREGDRHGNGEIIAKILGAEGEEVVLSGIRDRPRIRQHQLTVACDRAAKPRPVYGTHPLLKIVILFVHRDSPFKKASDCIITYRNAFCK